MLTECWLKVESGFFFSTRNKKKKIAEKERKEEITLVILETKY